MENYCQYAATRYNFAASGLERDMAHILLVEDEPMLRRTLRAILEKAGHAVEEAADGEQAIEMFAATGAELIITDIVMPNKEGVELIRELRGIDAHVPIIAMSGGGATGGDLFLRLAGLLGATTTLPKPIRQATLLEAVGKSLAGGDRPQG